MEKWPTLIRFLDTFWQEMADHPGEIPEIPLELFEVGSEERRLLERMQGALQILQKGTRRRQNERLRRDMERMLAVWWSLLNETERMEELSQVQVQLTPREQQVLILMAEGLDNGEIGARLFVSAATVKSHVSAVLAKLDVESRTEAVALALRMHWIK